MSQKSSAHAFAHPLRLDDRCRRRLNDGIGVNARTAFSLFIPPILEELHWDRGVTAGAFSFGFAVFSILRPLIGGMMHRVGSPRGGGGVNLMAAGLLGAPLVTEPWHL